MKLNTGCYSKPELFVNQYMMKYRFITILILLLTGILLVKVNSMKKNLIQNKENYYIQESNNEPGKAIYLNHCMSCHQIDGSGVQSMYPPLKNSNWVTGDKSKLINVVLKGLQGSITVNEETYNGNMPRQDYLSNQQISDLLTYIRHNFENKASAIKPEEVAKLGK